MTDSLLARYWRSLIGFQPLPRYVEPVEEQDADSGRIPGLIDESN